MITRNFKKAQLIKFDTDRVTDHNRGELSVDFERIESSTRMANGTLRKQVIATKRTFSCSWDDVPHTSEYTVDGFWGGREMYEFYMDQVGPFWLNITEGDGTLSSYYVVIEQFDHSIKKRGLYDFWDMSIRMVEV